MIIVIYILAIILFSLSELLSSIMVRSIYFILVKRNSALYQFIGEFFGGIIGFCCGLKVFSWFEYSFNPIILGSIFIVIWQITNSNILPNHFPNAQRLGNILGLLLIMYLY